MKQFADSAIATGDALKLAAGFIPRAHREIVLLEQRNAVMASAFRQLAERLDGLQGAKTLLIILTQASLAQMGLDTRTAAELLKAARQWLADRGSGLIIL